MIRIPAFILLTIFTQILCAQKAAYKISSHDKDSFGIVEIRQGGYKLINPLLDCYQVDPPGLRQMKVLEKKIRDYIAVVKLGNKVDQVSVYYRDLSNGPWLGIDEDAPYAPASLLKVPILIVALKYAEQQPGFLNKKIVYTPSGNTVKQNILSDNILKPGTTYTVKELLERMIKYSDNEAKNLIESNLPASLVGNFLFDMGMSLEKLQYSENFMTVKEYASFFRILYNATYLDKKMSEMALTILTQTTFSKGIVAGVPAGTLVAHKFGERTMPNKNIRQLHDCGIIYKSGQPYLLCIMTRGKDFSQLETIITHLSKIVYDTLKTKP